MVGVGSWVCFINRYMWIWECFSTGPSQVKKESCLAMEEHKPASENVSRQDPVRVLVTVTSPAGLAEQ